MNNINSQNTKPSYGNNICRSQSQNTQLNANFLLHRNRFHSYTIKNNNENNVIGRSLNLTSFFDLNEPSYFVPGIHSTPIQSIKCDGKRNVSNLTGEINTIKRNNENIVNNYHYNYHNKINTISESVNTDEKFKVPIYYTKAKLIKRRNLKGISWILNLSMNDDSSVKLYRIKLTIFVVVFFILLGMLLGYYSKYFKTHILIKFSNYSVAPPKFFFDVNDTITLTELTNITKIRYSSTEIQKSITNENITDKEFGKSVHENELSHKTDKNLNSTINFMLKNVCTNCKNTEVCFVEKESNKPQCHQAIDIHDPTGCGGLCALDTEACYLVHRNYSIYTCIIVETVAFCKSNEWRCKNDFCIPKEKHCDGLIDCYDRSDEEQCEECDHTSNFKCGNNTSCMENSKKCNGIVDCWDGSDEYHCTSDCHKNQFKCKNQECIQFSLFCDGLPDCEDASDEPKGCMRKCNKFEYQCENTRCIPLMQKCNGIDNCKDMSDEYNCSHKSIPT